MIDPETNRPWNGNKYDQTTEQLEEMIIFWLLVAGKTAQVISKRLENIFNEYQPTGPRKPFEMFRKIRNLPAVLRKHGIGCYKAKALGIKDLVNSDIDLHNCTVDDLTKIYGIGPKTARCFIIHSRRDAQYAGLDVHILRGLRERGYQNVPESTPSSKKTYQIWEQVVLKVAKQENLTPAEYDMSEWLKYRRAVSI